MADPGAIPLASLPQAEPSAASPLMGLITALKNAWSAQPSWADRMHQASQQQQATYAAGGPQALLHMNPQPMLDLMGGFVGSTTPEAGAAKGILPSADSLTAEGAKSAHKVVSAAHGALESHLSNFEDATSDLELAHSDLHDVGSELKEGEEYTDPADQKDWEDRFSEAQKEAGQKAIAARDKLQAIIDAAHQHLGKINDIIAEHLF